MAVDRRIFDTEFLHKLEYLSLVSKKLHRGRARGEHLAYRRGTSLEFFDYRAYQPGDDFRYIDWNIFSRLDRLVVKLFSAEEDLSVHLLIDISRSMSYGDPRKIDYARKIGAALAYVGISNLDRVGLATFGSGIKNTYPLRRSRRQVFALFDAISRISCRGGTHLNGSLEEYARKASQPGLAIVISDMLDPRGYQKGLLALLFRRFDVVLVQVLDETELVPEASGDLKLVDMETGKNIRVSFDESTREVYRKELGTYFREIEDFCLGRGIEYLRISTRVPFEDLILKYLRQGLHLH